MNLSLGSAKLIKCFEVEWYVENGTELMNALV